MKAALNGSGPRRFRPVITDSSGSPGGTHHISPKLRRSTKRSSWPWGFQNRTRVWLQGSFGLSIQRNCPVIRRCTPQWPASAPDRVRRAIKYLPRRIHCSTLQPSRAEQNCSGTGGEAMARARKTSTRSIVKPWVWRSRPRRTVSTSGSSGTRRPWRDQGHRLPWSPRQQKSPTCCQAGDR